MSATAPPPVTAAGSPALPGDTLQSAGPLVLYDGVCGLCNGFVRFVLRFDRRGSLRFATIQGEYGDATRRLHPDLAGVDSIVFVDRAEVLSRSGAVLRILAEMGGIWRAGVALGVVPRFLRDAVYDWVARNRYGWFGRLDSCPIPTAEVRQRFLD